MYMYLTKLLCIMQPSGLQYKTTFTHTRKNVNTYFPSRRFMMDGTIKVLHNIMIILLSFTRKTKVCTF